MEQIKCPDCGFTGTLDDFDGCGLTDEFDSDANDPYDAEFNGPCGDLICNKCACIFQLPKETQRELFT